MLGLLLSPQTQDPDTHQPVLHHISSTKAAYGKDSATLHNRTQAIYLYLVAILRASTLTPAEKSGFCASAHLGAARVRSTAAQAAMKAHNPEAAAAMVCAVLDTAETRHQGILLASLGVGIREVLSALAGLGPYQRGWLTAVMESIEASGLDPSVISALKREFGPRSSQSPT